MATSPFLSEDDLHRFRTKPCRRERQKGCDFGRNRCQYSHNQYWPRRCPFYLTDKNALRYLPYTCPLIQLRETDVTLTNKCDRGGHCPFSHSWEEVFYHPLFYKTTVCKAFHQGNCDSYYCPLIHGLAEQRTVTRTYTLPYTRAIVLPDHPNVMMQKRAERTSRSPPSGLRSLHRTDVVPVGINGCESEDPPFNSLSASLPESSSAPGCDYWPQNSEQQIATVAFHQSRPYRKSDVSDPTYSTIQWDTWQGSDRVRPFCGNGNEDSLQIGERELLSVNANVTSNGGNGENLFASHQHRSQLDIFVSNISAAEAHRPSSVSSSRSVLSKLTPSSSPHNTDSTTMSITPPRSNISSSPARSNTPKTSAGHVSLDFTPFREDSEPTSAAERTTNKTITSVIPDEVSACFTNAAMCQRIAVDCTVGDLRSLITNSATSSDLDDLSLASITGTKATSFSHDPFDRLKKSPTEQFVHFNSRVLCPVEEIRLALQKALELCEALDTSDPLVSRAEFEEVTELCYVTLGKVMAKRNRLTRSGTAIGRLQSDLPRRDSEGDAALFVLDDVEGWSYGDSATLLPKIDACIGADIQSSLVRSESQSSVLPAGLTAGIGYRSSRQYIPVTNYQ
eukprot:GHVN01066935.1.p1 GENE.GHVN01066935.1~~GHVN01066935.1.p1  ORF type:complete len:621 (+),score=65.00 GHVN01066935.1:160-2022(+)